ncbi:hypothetical protein V6U89_26125 [Micromonospora sp. CPCC 206171]|uniref:hypothetical protein n=1 Tax=Micromonospora sp. CPCC 206171 TaxID=3122405 RepID=UPI002FF35E26
MRDLFFWKAVPGGPEKAVLAGDGLFTIAEGLTANRVPCPSAHDRARNPWWNPRDKWVVSKDITHPPLIDDPTFEEAQALLNRRRQKPTAKEPGSAPATNGTWPRTAWTGSPGWRTSGSGEGGEPVQAGRFGHRITVGAGTPPTTRFPRIDAGHTLDQPRCPEGLFSAFELSHVSLPARY